MKILILGGTGFIGRNVAINLSGDNKVTVLTRDIEKAKNTLATGIDIIEANIMSPGTWQFEVGKHDVVINLIGEPMMGKRWSKERKTYLVKTRTVPTRLVIDAIEQATDKPKTFLSGSAIGYYGDRGSDTLDEQSMAGIGFSAELCDRWEEVANRAKRQGVRVINLRTSFVLGRDAASLKKLAAPYKACLGGPMGSGRQYMPWIHIDDYLNLISFAIENESINGPLNMSSSIPVTNKEFSKILGRTLRRPSLIPIPGAILKLLLGESSSLMLDSDRVIPKKAKDAGFEFKYESLSDALGETLRRAEK